MGSPLKAVHLYRKVPHDLSKATNSGGLLSLAVLSLMAWLLASNVRSQQKKICSHASDAYLPTHSQVFEYLEVKVQSAIVFDQSVDDVITAR